MTQTTDSVLMIRPVCFGFNFETATSNRHQTAPQETSGAVQRRALEEFDGLAQLLIKNAISVEIIADEPLPHTPDSIFPNNWFSTHEDGTLVLYPMATPSRRAERRPRIIEALCAKLASKRVIDLSQWESREKYLEGTGSLVLDRVRRIAYAARSVRTHDEVVFDFAQALNYRPIFFDTHLRKGRPEYHTNVVMSVGESSAVVCLAAIRHAEQRDAVCRSLNDSGVEIIDITLEQLDAFAGNLLQLRSAYGSRLWVMSDRAFSALRADQKSRLTADAPLVHTPLSTIESVGGGSARCMLAELFFSA